jgi:hypothetical protein
MVNRRTQLFGVQYNITTHELSYHTGSCTRQDNMKVCDGSKVDFAPGVILEKHKFHRFDATR